jgi:two-component sensor histidine kinase
LAVITFNEIALRESREQEIADLALAAARQASLEIERLTSGTEGILRSIALTEAIRTFDRARCEDYLAQLTSHLPQFFTITVLDGQGESRCRSDRATAATSYADQPYFKDALSNEGQLAVGEYMISAVTGKPGLPLALAIEEPGPTPTGVVVAALDLDWLGGILRERQLAHHASLTIADRNGTIIAREPFPERFIGTVIPEAYQHLVNAAAAGSIEVTSQDGTRRILGYIPVGQGPRDLYVSAGIAWDEAFAAADGTTRRSIILGLAATGLALLLAWLLGRRLVRGPVNRISMTLAARQAGDDQARTGMRAPDGELEALGAEIDAYMDALNRNRAERDRAEQARELLAQELSHRMKNVIATIQAIAHQTLRGEGLSQARLEAFNARLVGIGRAQDLLTFRSSEQVTLHDALANAVGVFEPTRGSRFTLAGPEIVLRPEAALSVAMAAHELATNAVKYGALSVDSGHVDVDWNVLASPRPTLLLTWREHGGPTVAAPQRKGFGSKMVEGVLAGNLGAEVRMEFDAAGLRCVWKVPLADAVGFAGAPRKATA